MNSPIRFAFIIFSFLILNACKKENSVNSDIELEETEYIKFDFNNQSNDFKYRYKSGGFELKQSLDGFFGFKNSIIINRQNGNGSTFLRATLVFEQLNPDTIKTFPRVFPNLVKPFEAGAKLYFDDINTINSNIFAVGVTRDYDSAINLGGLFNITITDVKNGIVTGTFAGVSNGLSIKSGTFNVRYK
jgi:hypothetical protein